MKITEDFIGNETKTLTKTKISTILRWWGFNPDSYSTWGNARSDMNNILSGTPTGEISDRERASTFLSKINYVNDTDAIIGDTIFAAGVPGVWYDPSDLSTLFQDTAGTIPVTGVEQPVGLMLDKSGNGKHASQATTTARPILSARYNLLTQTENLAHADWGSNVTQLVDGQVDAPDGTTTAFRMSGKSGLSVTPTRAIAAPTGALKFSIFLRHISGGASNINTLVRNTTSATNLVTVNLGQGGSGTTSYGSWTKTNVGNDWFRIDISVTSGVSPSDTVSVYLGRTNTPTVDQVWDVWHPDLRALSDANLPYQWVNTATDYDTTGFPHYLRFDGVDDHLNLGVLNMSAASTVGYFSAITKLSDVSPGRWYSHSLTTSAGSVRLLAPANAGQTSVRTGFYSSSGLKEVGGQSHAAPITLTVRSEIEPGGDGMWITHNNGAKLSTTVDPTVFSADGEACIGAQVTSGSRFQFLNGRLYSLIVTGKKSNISEHGFIESFLRQKSKAY